MKKMNTLIVMIAMLLCSLAASAHDFEVDGIYYNIISEEDLTVEVTYKGDSGSSYNEYIGEVPIPEFVTYNNTKYRVTSIGYRAFSDCSSLTSITIPESVTNIGICAFYNCYSLTSIIIPESVTSIGDYAFDDTSWYDNQPNGVIYAGKVLYKCKGTIPENTSLEVREGTISISNYAFSGCSNLASISIPESVTSIGDYAFEDCSNLTSITILEGVTSVGRSAFDGTPWYDNQPDGVIYVGKVLYEYKGTMPSNTSIEVREGTVSISNSAFNNCSNLTSITLPESVTSIGKSAFYNCSSLTSITIPESVTSIESYAFYDCRSLAYITVPESVTEIGQYAFYGCRSLARITIPESVTSIESNAFCDCRSLTSITIPEGVTSIGEKAFAYCSSLAAITIPENVTSIGEHAFSDCSSLTSITIPESVTSIESYAFYDCRSLTAVHISSIEAWCKILLKKYNLNYAYKLYLKGELVTELFVPDGVTSIGNFAFSNCSSLTSVTIPESVTSIGNYAFRGCSNLASVTIPESVTEIGQYAFYGCSKLKTISLPTMLSMIKMQTFYNCGSLECISIPENVEFIYQEAFAGCSALKSIKVLAIEPPFAYDNTFSKYSIGLCVPEEAMEAYRTTAPWSSFGSIVSLDAAITHIALSETAVTLTEGETNLLTITTTPEDADRNLVSWSSSNPNVASIDNTGTITAIAPGTATITVTANDGGGVSASCVVTVEAAVEELGGLIIGKNYRLKNVSTGLYLQVSGNNTNMTLQNKAAGIELAQVFQLEDAGDDKYYIKAADTENEYYAHASSWNFNATNNTVNKTPFTIALVEGETGVYTLYQSVSSHIGNAGSDASEAGSPIYCNKSVGQNGKWVFEPLSREENAAYVNAFTAVAKEQLDAAIARAEAVLATRSALLSAEEVAGINSAVQTAKENKDALTEVGALKALSDAINTVVDDAIYVQSLDELSNGVCYVVATENRGAWYAQDERLNSTTKLGVEIDITDVQQQFAFVQSPATGNYYLYSVGEENFVKKDGNYAALTEVPEQTISFLEGTRSERFPWVVAFNTEDGQKQIAVSNGYNPAIVTNWNSLSDDGNTIRFEKAATFNASAAIDAITAYEKDDVIITINQYRSGTYCSRYALDFSEVNGLKAYAVTGYDTESGEVTLSRVMTAKAGTGLFIKGEPGDYTIPILENSSFNTLNMLVGTSKAVTLGRTSEDGLYVNYKYTLSGNNAKPQFYVFDDGFTLGAGKAYLQVPTEWMPVVARAIALRFIDRETTDVENLELENQDQKPIYDLMGRRVEVPVKGSVYIVNGKKIVY